MTSSNILIINLAEYNIQTLMDTYSVKALKEYKEIVIADEDFAPIPTSLSMIQYLADSTLAKINAKTKGTDRQSRFWEELAFVPKLTVEFESNTRSFRTFKQFNGTFLLKNG